MNDDTPHFHGHRRRLRERFLKAGLGGFADYEVVELLLTLAVPRADVKQPAKALIARFGNLRGILDARTEELQGIPGIGSVTPVALKIIKAAATLYLQQSTEAQDSLAGAPTPDECFVNTQKMDGGQFCLRVLRLSAQRTIVSDSTQISAHDRRSPPRDRTRARYSYLEDGVEPQTQRMSKDYAHVRLRQAPTAVVTSALRNSVRPMSMANVATQVKPLPFVRDNSNHSRMGAADNSGAVQR